MKKSFRVLSILVSFLVLLPALPMSAGVVEDALKAFDKAPSAQAANAFFAGLLAEGFIDEEEPFPEGTPLSQLKGEVWYWAGEWFNASQDYTTAAAYAEKALPEFPEQDESSRADCLNILAISYFRLSDFSKAADYARLCLELDEKSGDPDRISSSLNTLAGIHVGANQPEQAEKYILRALEYAKKAGNPARLAVLQGTASEVFHAEGKDEEALRYADAAYQTEVSLGREYNSYVRLAQKASVLLGLNRWDESEALLGKIIPYFKSVGDAHSLGIADNKMGMTLLALKRYSDALPFYREAADIFLRMKDSYNELQSRRGLYEALWRLGEHEAANAEFYRFNDIKDSLYQVSSAEALARYDAEFGNGWLRLENHDEKEARLRTARIGIAVALLLALLAAGIWLLMRRRNRAQAEANAELSRDISELRKKYSELHIRYDQLRLAHGSTASLGELPVQDKGFLDQVTSVVDELIAEGSVDAGKAAERLHMSPYQFRQRLSVLTGETPQSFIHSIRMRRACHLLDNNPELTVTEISELCAYSDVASFTRSFKNAVGMTPTQYQGRQK